MPTYVRTLDRFFFRKISSEATALRAACLARAAEPDDGAALDPIGRPRPLPAEAAGPDPLFPAGGAVLSRPVRRPRPSGARGDHRPLRGAGRANGPCPGVGGPAARAAVRRARRGLLPAAVDFGPGRPQLGGLRRTDTAIRDQHPALWLARVRARVREARGGVPILLWAPTDQRRLLSYVARDPAALIVGLPPLAATRRTTATS